MVDEKNDAAFSKTVAEVPAPESTDIEQLQRGYHNLLHRVSDLERLLDNTRREVSEARWGLKLLRNTTTDLLAPIMLVGAASFLFGWIEAKSWYDYVIVGGAGTLGICWLRNVSRSFDGVTKAP